MQQQERPQNKGDKISRFALSTPASKLAGDPGLRASLQPFDHAQGRAEARLFAVRSNASLSAGCNGMLPLSATLCCHWRHSRHTIILPPGAIQSCHLIRSDLDCQIQTVRGGMATPVGATGSKVRFARKPPITKKSRKSCVNIVRWVPRRFGTSCPG